MTPLTEQKRRKLQAAFDYANKAFKRDGARADTVIAGLAIHHGAKWKPRWDASRLSCAGVTATCTWSKDEGLLRNWLNTAGLRLMGVPA